MKTQKTEPVQPPVPIRDTQYWLCLSTTECLALADGVVLDSVRQMAGMVDHPRLVQGQEPYGVVIG